jgi:hypothetical protein
MEMLLDINTKNRSECKIRYAGHCHITLGLQFCENAFVQVCVFVEMVEKNQSNVASILNKTIPSSKRMFTWHLLNKKKRYQA